LKDIEIEKQGSSSCTSAPLDSKMLRMEASRKLQVMRRKEATNLLPAAAAAAAAARAPLTGNQMF
jgi:hypothetical protein